MNTVIQLLAQLAEKDIRLWMEDGKLRFSAPEGAMTPEIRDRIVTHKEAIIEFLGQVQKQQVLAIPHCDRGGRLPASFAQQRLWFLNRLDPESPAYNMAGALRLTGRLDVAALNQALTDIVVRHEVLRTRYVEDEHGLKLAIEPAKTMTLVPLSLPANPCGTLDEIIQTLAKQEAAMPFDLTRDSVLRAKLYKLAGENDEGDYLLLTTLHHIASDGWSMGVLVDELAALYTGYCDGRQSPLPALPLQYTDYAAWQRDWLAGERLEKQLQFWCSTLANVPILQLPTDRPRAAMAGSSGDSLLFEIDAVITTGLNQLARQHNATLFMVLSAALRILLSRYSGQSDICIGTPVAGRPQAQLESLIGCFVNTIAIRAELDYAATFSTALAAENSATQSALDHQDVPFEQVVDALHLTRDMAFTPVFQVMLVLQNTPVNYGTRLPGLVITPIDLKKSAAMFDLKLTLNEVNGRIFSELEYRADLWQRSSIEAMCKSFVTLLQGIVSDPARVIAEYPLLTTDAMSALLSTTGNSWNATQHPLPAVNALHTLIEQQVERTPHHPAVSFEGASWTYRELNGRANQLAHCLIGLGIGPGTLVGVCIERGLNMSLALLATLKAGAAYVPFDPTFPADRLGFMLDDTAVTVMLTATHLQQVLPAQPQHVLCLDRDAELWSAMPQHNPATAVTPDNLFNVIFTSGSTGKPKGVMVPHIGIINRLLWMQDTYPLTFDDRVLQKTPYSFDVSVWELFWPLLVGAEIVYARPEGHKDPDYLCELIQRERISTLHFVPSMLGIFLQNEKLQNGNVGQCRSIKRVFCSGEALQLAHEKRFFEKLPNAELHNLYGPTEASVDVSYYPCSPNSPYRSVPIGKPVWNTQLHVLDVSLQPVPVGVVGELYIGGIQLAHGYLKRDELTRNTFIDNPHYRENSTDGHPSKKLYKTGDLARYLPDGNIEYIGRVDFQVKVRGLRIELGEIETVLMRHPEVKEALVVVSEIGSGNVIIVAYFVPRDDGTVPDSQVLRTFLQKDLPQYMIPNVFMALQEIPLSANGKANRKALPAPDLSQLARAEYLAPRNDTEQIIADIFAEVLGIERISIHDNFFELGGHSLLATRIISRLRELTQAELPLRVMFDRPTVAGIAEALAHASRSELPPLVRNTDGNAAMPLSFAQQRLWLIDQLAPGSAMYNIPLAVKITGSLDRDALQRSLAEIVRRHDSLRTRFITDDHGEARQLVEPFQGWTLEQATASNDPQQLHRQVLAFMMEPFRLDAAPLLRVQLLKLPAANEYVLLACLHHIITDGWSMDVLLGEIAALYPAFAAGRPSALPELTVQYTDFAMWQQKIAATGYYERQLDYWRQQLANVPVLQLPTDKLRPAMLDGRGRVLPFVLDKELAIGTKRLAQRNGATLYQTLLATFQLLLARYSGQDDIAVGSPVANRPQAALEPIIGFFVNTLVMRTQIDTTEPFTALLAKVRNTTIEAHQHQDQPFEQLIEALRVPRDLSNTPLVQVMFILQGGDSAAKLDKGATLGNITLSSVRDASLTEVPTKFDLTLSISERDDELHGELEYRSSLWHEASMHALGRHFETLLRAVIAEPARAVGEYPLLTDSEMAALMATDGSSWNATQHALPAVDALHTLIEQQVLRTPAAAAVSYNGNSWSYDELNQRANRLAHYLRELGVGPGALVGVCLERSLDMSLALLATLKAGAAYVPFDPTFPADRLGFMLEDTEVSVMLTATHLTNVPPSQPTHMLCLERDAALWSQMPQTNPAVAVQRDHLFNVIFTSGSTGKPKGVMVPHIGIINRLLWMQDMYPLKVGDRVLQKTPYSFDVSVWELFWPLLVGAEIVYAKPEGHKDPDYLCELIQRERISTLHFVPSMLGIFLQNESASACTSVKRVFCSGEALQLAHEKRFFEKLPHAELHNLYGPTEASVDVSYYACSPNSPYRSVPIGKPVWNTQLHVLDIRLQPVPVGVVGELYIGGIQLAHGYLKRDELTRNTFIDNPHYLENGAHGHPSPKLYKTGDLARYLPDGNIEYIGRVDFQVKVRGLRIELGEIETVLMRHPLIKESIVVVQDLGSGNVIIVAYFVPHNHNVIPNAQTLRVFLKQDLPVYMLPNVYMALDEIPLSANGKANRKALPPPDLSQITRAEYVAPRDELEQTLASIFAAALGCEKVGINDNIFELGGHSLTATQIMARIKAQYQLPLEVRHVFELPTVAELSALLRDQLQQQSVLFSGNDAAADDEEEFTL